MICRFLLDYLFYKYSDKNFQNYSLIPTTDSIIIYKEELETK